MKTIALFMFVLLGMVWGGSLKAQNLAWHWANPQPHGNDIVDMASNGSLVVQVADMGQLYTSQNSTDWFAQNTQTTNDLQGVTYLGGRMIICGANGTVGYSDDGVTFTTTNLNTANWLVSVASSSNLVVAVGDNGTVFTSSNGVNWQLRFGNGTTTNLPGYNGNWLTSVAYGANGFVLTGDEGNGTTSYLANSGDGIHWTNRTTASINGNLERVAFVNTASPGAKFPPTGFWVVTDTGYAYYSTNGGGSWNAFNALGTAPYTNVLYAIASDLTSGLVAGDNAAILGRGFLSALWNSQIGSSNQLASVAAWPYYAALWNTNGSYQLAGSDGFIEQSTLTNGAYLWSNPYNSSRDWLWQVTLANGLYVAVGDNGRILTSDNGADWSIEAFTATNSIPAMNSSVLFCVGGNSNLLLAAGNSGSLVASPNLLLPVLDTNSNGSFTTNYASSLGVAWYALSAPAGTTNDLAGVCTYSNRFYLVGGNGSIFSLSFTNWNVLTANNLNRYLGGSNWTKLSSPSTNYLSGVTVFTNGLVVSGDQGTILTSPDGANWTRRISGTTNWLFRVQHATNLLVAVGENGSIFTSSNSVNWVSQHSGTSNWLNDAVMVSNTCFVVGNSGSVLASTNLAIWTNVPIITSRSLYSAASQNGQLVVAGLQGTILQAQVIPLTTPVNIVDYTQASGLNLFTVSGTVNQQFTLDASTNLLNWVTGPLLSLVYGDGSLVFYTSEPTNTPRQFYRCKLKP